MAAIGSLIITTKFERLRSNHMGVHQICIWYIGCFSFLNNHDYWQKMTLKLIEKPEIYILGAIVAKYNWLIGFIIRLAIDPYLRVRI